MGVFDILQSWTLGKRMEQFLKVNILQLSKSGISCIPPDPYRRRFQAKVNQIIEHSIFVREITGSWVGKRVVSTASTIDPNTNSNNANANGIANTISTAGNNNTVINSNENITSI